MSITNTVHHYQNEYRNADAVGRSCRGTFNLANATLSAPTSQTSFILTESSGRRHHLKALSEHDKLRWTKALSERITTAQGNIDTESDAYSDDVVISDQNSHPSSFRRKRFFRNRSKLETHRDLSSTNSPSGGNHRPESAPHSPLFIDPNLASSDTHMLMNSGKTKKSHDTTDYSTVPELTHLINRLRRSSSTIKPNALTELMGSVDHLKTRLKQHTKLVYTQLSTIESFLSSSVANRSSPSPDGVIPSETSTDTVRPIRDSEPAAQNMHTVFNEHRRHISEFHETCDLALQFIGANFERWHRRFQIEQERCVGLERTVEQLARQHRELELQLSKCYAPLEESSFDVSRPAHCGTLRRDTTHDTTEHHQKRVSSYGEASDEDDEFYDARSVSTTLSQESVVQTRSKPPKSRELLKVTRSEGLHASATSLPSVQYEEESSGSDSSSEGPVDAYRDPMASNIATQLPINKLASIKSNREVQPRSSLLARQRRTTIPESPKIALNLWSIIRNGIGKDITKIPLPVNFNEPISFLQRASEDLTYSFLLDEASQTRDAAEQIALVAAFSVSCYASTAIRTGKPFNPLLGETFEFDRSNDSYGWRLISEQVTHHPPGSALHCESVRYGWKLWVEFVLVSKFRGKYMSVLPKGTVNLLLPDGSRYTWTKATTVVHNMIVGTLWIDNYGEVNIQNHTNGYSCPMRFLAHTYFSRGPAKQVTGVIQSASGTPLRIVRGAWNSYMETLRVSPDGTPIGEPQVLWTATPLSPDAEKIYNFSQFTIELNQSENGIAPTDSRNRLDQRLMEDGKWDEANEEKCNLEIKQRAKRYAWEEKKSAGVEPVEALFIPIWFTQKTDPVTGETSSVYLDNYWQAKEAQNWTACPDIY